MTDIKRDLLRRRADVELNELWKAHATYPPDTVAALRVVMAERGLPMGGSEGASTASVGQADPAQQRPKVVQASSAEALREVQNRLAVSTRRTGVVDTCVLCGATGPSGIAEFAFPLGYTVSAARASWNWGTSSGSSYEARFADAGVWRASACRRCQQMEWRRYMRPLLFSSVLPIVSLGVLVYFRGPYIGDFTENGFSLLMLLILAWIMFVGGPKCKELFVSRQHVIEKAVHGRCRPDIERVLGMTVRIAEEMSSEGEGRLFTQHEFKGLKSR